MRPSPARVWEEIIALREEQDPEDGELDYAFISGMLRGLEWSVGGGMPPSDFLRACSRVQRVN